MDVAAGSRIGILGGTFNPIHMGHMILAQGAIERFDLARVLFIPCAVPPHKSAVGLIDSGHRLAMVRAATEDDPRFDVLDLDIRRSGPSYAIDTVSELRELFPDTELCFIIGADMLLELHLWKDAYRLLELCTFLSFSRGDVGVSTLDPDRLNLAPPWPERLLGNSAEGRRVDLSSSELRHRVAEGLSIRYLVPAAVEMYIAEHGLYRN
jgi:nicotinate-nucleotide adenylyltransferase